MVAHARSNHGEPAHRLSAELHSQAEAVGLHPTGEFTLGRDDDHRIPDVGWTSSDVEDSALSVPSVEIVVEIECPGDETRAEVAFSFEHGVAEVWVITPHAHTVRLLTAVDQDASGSQFLSVSLADVRAALGRG